MNMAEMVVIGFLFVVVIAACFGLRNALADVRERLDSQVKWLESCDERQTDRTWEHYREFAALRDCLKVSIYKSPERIVATLKGGPEPGP